MGGRRGGGKERGSPSFSLLGGYILACWQRRFPGTGTSLQAAFGFGAPGREKGEGEEGEKSLLTQHLLLSRVELIAVAGEPDLG